MNNSPPNLSRYWFVQPEDLRTTASMDYHEHSKTSEFFFRFGLEDPKKTEAMMRLINSVAGKSKNFAYCPSYPLEAADWETLDCRLGRLLAQRRSRRNLIRETLPFPKLSTLLACAIGVNGALPIESGSRTLRSYPSGGGLF